MNKQKIRIVSNHEDRKETVLMLAKNAGAKGINTRMVKEAFGHGSYAVSIDLLIGMVEEGLLTKESVPGRPGEGRKFMYKLADKAPQPQAPPVEISFASIIGEIDTLLFKVMDGSDRIAAMVEDLRRQEEMRKECDDNLAKLLEAAGYKKG